MNVDEVSEVAQVDLFSYFVNDTSESLPWCHTLSEQIELRRDRLSGLLIIDILLTTGGIHEPRALYPPSDAESLKALLSTIEKSTFDALKKDCLVYYLLKWHQDGRERVFQHDKCIPPHFVLLTDAYWHLDSDIRIETAVAILSDVRLNRDHVSKTLEALSLSKNATSLILKYVQTAKPSLVERADIDLYVTALAESNLWDAWRYQRTFLEESEFRQQTLHKILHWCLSPKPRAMSLAQLVTFPFTDYEQSLVHEYALHPPSECPNDSVPAIQDLVCLRLVQGGQFAAAIKLDRQFSQNATKLMPKMKKANEDRRRMLDDIAATMPTVERNLLQAELDQLARGKPLSSVFSLESREPSSNDMAMSWENVSPPRVTVNGTFQKSPQQQPFFSGSQIPEGSFARRFGVDGSLSAAVNGSDITLVPISQPVGGNSSQLRPPTFVSSVVPQVHSHTSPFHDSLQLRAASSRLSGLGHTPTRSGPGLFTGIPARTVLPALNNTVASANLARNAFYEPPVTNGVKRPYGQDEPRPAPQKSTMPTRPLPPPNSRDDDDVDMYSEDESEQYADHSMNSAEKDQNTLPFSIFSPAENGVTSSGPSKRMERHMKMPPGAFVEESDEERVPERTIRRKGGRTTRLSPPQATTSKSRNSVRETNVNRRIPGALIMEEDEEGDQIGSLPPSTLPKRSTRRGKTSRTNSVASTEEPKAPRRSSRLNAPSRASSSPEPLPKKVSSQSKKSTRTSTAATKSGSRKKR